MASVGNGAGKHASHCVSWTTRVRFVSLGCFFGDGVRSFVLGGESYLRTRGMIVSPSVIVCIW